MKNPNTTDDNIAAETVKSTLSIELTVTCPKCDHFFDMVSDTDLNEEGWLLNQVLPDTAWIYSHNDFRCTVECPECGTFFEVAGVEWC